MIDFLMTNSTEILSKSLEHLFIASISLFFGVLLAVPLGIFLTRSKTLAKVVMAIASVLQTVPSFALLALMIPIFGVGKKPAIVSLFIYSLLPILRNTYLGIAGVNDKLIDAAKGMGMTRSQILLKVQILIIIYLPITLISISGLNGEDITYILKYLINYYTKSKYHIYLK